MSYFINIFRASNPLHARKQFVDSSLYGSALFLVFFVISTFNLGKLTSDEAQYHFQNVINFSRHGLTGIFDPAYSAANMPLPYILLALMGKLIPVNILMTRVVTCLVSLAAFFAIVRFLSRYQVHPLYASIILFYPYFLVNSFVFYIMNYGVFFMVAGLLFVPDAGLINRKNSFATGLIFMMAVLCQQFYLFIPVALVMTNGIYFFRHFRNSRKVLYQFLFTGLLILIPLVVPLLIFIKWGGLTHPNFRIHSVSFQPTTFVAILSIIGFYSLPFLAQIRKSFSMGIVISFLIISISLAIFLMPGFNDQQGPGLFTGIVFHLFNLTMNLWWLFPRILVTVFTCLGLLTGFHLIKTSRTIMEHFILLSCFLLVLTYCFNSLLGERHILPLMILIFLLIIPRLNPRYLYPYIISMAVLGTCYFIFWNYIKFGFDS